MRRTRGAWWAGVVLVAGGLVVGPAGAAHAVDRLELSLDGTSWSASLPGRLFSSPAAVVPGDVLSSALWVRNSSGDPARVDLEVADDLGVTPGTFAGDLSLSIDGTPVPGGTSWHGPDLAPGASARIPLVVTFAASSSLSSSVSVAAVLESVTLVQTGAGPAVSPTPTGTPTAPAGGSQAASPPTRGAGGLAHTGTDVGSVLGVSFAALGLGVLLLAARRRSRRADA
ncbi:hypothetical protein [Cellulomonas sp.]|uniref:hypothetical protein n=1 Tax=Cellulomonas sp. TaxID=40001 RepID=UPI003BAD53C3